MKIDTAVQKTPLIWSLSIGNARSPTSPGLLHLQIRGKTEHLSYSVAVENKLYNTPKCLGRHLKTWEVLVKCSDLTPLRVVLWVTFNLFRTHFTNMRILINCEPS